MRVKDSLTLYKELVDTGTPEAQAEVMAHQQGACYDILEEFRKQMNDFKTELKEDIGELRADILGLKSDNQWIIRIGGFMCAGIVAALFTIVMKICFFH